MSRDRRIRVCLVLEGTYPYVRGGVSSWTHQLIEQLPHIEFVLLTLSAKANQDVVYDVPDNVVDIQDLVVGSDGFELSESSVHDLVQRVEPLEAALDDPLLAELLAELRALAELWSYRRDRWKANFFGLIPGYRGGRWKASLESLWTQISRRYLRRNPYYGIGEYFWTWYNSRVTLLRLLEHNLPRADVYHALCTGYAGFIAARARLEDQTPFLLTEHGIYHRERLIEIEASEALRGNQRDQWSTLFLGLSRVAYKTADQVVTLFEANRKLELAMGVPPSKSSVIPNGIDLPRFTGVKRVKRTGKHIGMVGRVVPIKDVKTFLVAARVVAESVPDVHFWIVGPTDESPEYFDECQLMVRAFGLDRQVTFTGPADVREYYAFIDVLVLTSLSEAQPLVILEAVAAGVLCMGTLVGDVSSMLNNDERLLAAPKDAQGIGNRLIHICQHPEQYQSWIAERNATVRAHYDRVAIFRSYGDLYAKHAGLPQGAASWPA